MSLSWTPTRPRRRSSATWPRRSPREDGKGIFALTTQKGGRILVPADKIAFVEFSTDQARRVGFGNIV